MLSCLHTHATPLLLAQFYCLASRTASQDHDKNLAEDPSQLLTQAEKRRAAKLAHKELAAAAAAGVAGTAAAPRRSARLMARLKKVGHAGVPPASCG
jgi:ribosomal protein S20